MPPTRLQRLQQFVEYVALLRGDEKGEAQVFCDRFMQAFEHGGVVEAGARLEHRIKGEDSTRFADLVWPGILLLEMKTRGEKLERHYQQAFDYWIDLTPNKPK